ncbi:MAG: hypothetical protein R2748_33680 [Bryobacterales bacterium]
MWEKESQMVAMRKVAVLLALLAIAGIGSGVAQAQTIGLVTCQATAVPPVVRAEGIAELVGDIVLACTATDAAFAPTSAFLVNVSVSLNVNVTNNINFDATNVTDSVLIINENNCNDPVNTGLRRPSPWVQDPQHGVLAASEPVGVESSPLPGYPGASVDDQGTAFYPLATTLRISSVRANFRSWACRMRRPSRRVDHRVPLADTGPTTIATTNNAGTLRCRSWA